MLISVLMGVYNGAATVDAAIESIVAQTLGDWELLIVEDGSTDDTREHLARYTDPRIRVLHNERNLGLAASLNLAFRSSSGELVARMDADDVALPHRLEVQARFLREHPEIDVVGGWAMHLGETGVMTRPESHDYMARHAFTENPFIHPTVMMRRRVLEELGGYDETNRRGEDYDLWLRGITRFRYHNLQQPLIEYRRPTGPDSRQSADAAYVAWSHGLRNRQPLRGAYGAARYFAAFALGWLMRSFRRRS